VRARIQSGVGAEALPDDTLQKAEHVDLIQFGLIPEFVGRFPIMCSLQVNHTRRRQCERDTSPVLVRMTAKQCCASVIWF
jgi:hypothetical protein